jgi:superfamily II DNA or RNA helicase
VIHLVVDNRVRVRIEGDHPVAQMRITELKSEHEHPNPEYQKAKFFGFKKRIPRQIVTWQGDTEVSFPRGSLSKVRAALGPIGARIDDRRTLGDADLTGKIPKHQPPSGALWPHQEMLASVADAAQNALVRSAAASGKTTAALALASRLNLPTLVVVHNANLFDQWITRCVKELGVPRSWVGIIRGPKRKLGPITIGMQKTLYGCAAEVAPAFGLVIVDEVHRSAARTFLEVVDQMTARYRVGVSDDERRSDGKEFLIYDMFGPVVGEASHDDLVRQGYVMDVAVRVVPTEFRADWYQKLEPNEKLMAYQRLMELMATNDARNAQAVRDVPLDVASGHQVILFVDRVEHALTLDRMMNARDIRSGFVVGEHPEESAETLRRFGDGRANVVFGTYQALGTGIDMPRVSRGVFVTPIANSAKGRSQFKQYRGRFARAVDGKAQPEVAYLWDRYVFGSKPLRHLCRWARDVRVEWRGRLVSGREVLKEIEDDEAQRDDD